MVGQKGYLLDFIVMLMWRFLAASFSVFQDKWKKMEKCQTSRNIALKHFRGQGQWPEPKDNSETVIVSGFKLKNWQIESQKWKNMRKNVTRHD